MGIFEYNTGRTEAKFFIGVSVHDVEVDSVKTNEAVVSPHINITVCRLDNVCNGIPRKTVSGSPNVADIISREIL